MLIVCAGVLASGCTPVLRTEQADEAERLDVDAFWHDHLVKQPMVTTAEAYRAVLILADGEEQHSDFASREAALLERGVIRSEWKLPREACVDRGTVAYMLVRVLELRGGVNFMVFGELGLGERRYATRELVFREIMPAGASNQYLTGGEFLDLLIEADRYMVRHHLYEEKELDIERVIESDLKAAPGPPP